MSVKTELIAMAVRLASEKTSLIHKPDNFERFVTELLGGESYEVQVARRIEAEAGRGLNAIKQFRSNRHYTKITTVK